MTRRARWIALAVGALLAGNAAAFGFWSVTADYGAGHHAVATADSLPTGPTPTAVASPVANSATVGLSFSTSATTAGSRAITTYTIGRYATGASSPTSRFSCTPPAGGFTCTDAPGDGSWQYSVSAVIPGSVWTGAEGPKSAPVIIDTTAPSASMTFPVSGTALTAAAWSAGCTTAPFDVMSSICGTATDPGSSASGVSQVLVSIQSTSGPTNLKYWNGAGGFDRVAEHREPAALFGANWRLAFAAGSFPADGTYAIRAYATDAAANTQGSASMSTVTIDTTAPAVPAPGVAGTATFGSNPVFVSNQALTLTAAATDATAGVHAVAYYFCPAASGSCPVDTGTAIGTSTAAAGSYSVFWGPPLPAEGPYRIVAVATDRAGNVSGASTATFMTIDTTAPTVARPTVNGRP